MQGKRKAAAAKLDQPVVGPNNKKYWVTKNKDEIQFAKYFKENLYKKDKDDYKHHGMFILPKGDNVIVVDQKNPDKWRYPTKREEQKVKDYLQKYKAKYGDDAVPSEFFKKKNKAVQEQRKRHNNSEGEERQYRPRYRAPPPAAQHQPQQAPAPSQQHQHQHQQAPAPAQQHQHQHQHQPEQQVVQSAVETAAEKERKQIENTKELFKRHVIDVNVEDLFAYRTSFKLIRSVILNLVRLAKGMDYNDSQKKVHGQAAQGRPECGEKDRFTVDDFFKFDRFDQLSEDIAFFLQYIKRKYTEVGVPIIDVKYLEYLILAKECIDSSSEPTTELYNSNISLQRIFDIKHRPERIRQSASDYLGEFIIVDLKQFFETIGNETVFLLKRFAVLNAQKFRDKAAAAAADRLTGNDSGGVVATAMTALQDRVQRDPDTPVLKSSTNRVEYYKQLINSVYPSLDLRRPNADILHDVASKMTVQYFRHCCQCQPEFAQAVAELRNPELAMADGGPASSNRRFGFGGRPLRARSGKLAWPARAGKVALKARAGKVALQTRSGKVALQARAGKVARPF